MGRLCPSTLIKLLTRSRTRSAHGAVPTPKHHSVWTKHQTQKRRLLPVSGLCTWGHRAALPSADSRVSGIATSVCSADRNKWRPMWPWERDQGDFTSEQGSGRYKCLVTELSCVLCISDQRAADEWNQAISESSVWSGVGADTTRTGNTVKCFLVLKLTEKRGSAADSKKTKWQRRTFKFQKCNESRPQNPSFKHQSVCSPQNRPLSLHLCPYLCFRTSHGWRKSRHFIKGIKSWWKRWEM